MSNEMEKYLGKTVYFYPKGMGDGFNISLSNKHIDSSLVIQMTLDKIAYEKIGGITDELDDSDFPVFVSKELDSWCKLEWLKDAIKMDKDWEWVGED